LLVTKEELMTDLTNIMYSHTDAVEKLTKIKADSDKQLADLEAAAQAIVEMVEDGEAGNKTLVERLREAP